MGYVKELSDVDLTYAKGVHLKLLQNRTHKFNFGRGRNFEKLACGGMSRYVNTCLVECWAVLGMPMPRGVGTLDVWL